MEVQEYPGSPVDILSQKAQEDGFGPGERSPFAFLGIENKSHKGMCMAGPLSGDGQVTGASTHFLGAVT